MERSRPVERPEIARGLYDAHRRLERDEVIDIELEKLGRLLDDRERLEASAEYLTGVLGSARRGFDRISSSTSSRRMSFPTDSPSRYSVTPAGSGH